MEQQELLKSIISELDFEKVKSFLRLKSRYFSVDQKDFPSYKDDHFDDVEKLGEFAFDTFNKIVVFKLKIDRNLSEKTSKKLQYDKAKDILKQNNGYKAGMFFFYDKEGNFRLSLVYEILDGNKRKFNLYKRFTYFVRKGDHNQKTFIQQIGKGSYQSFRDIKDSFSVDKLSNEFYNAFEPKFTAICNSLHKRYEHDSEEVVKDFVLLFVIRIIFLGFIQKKKWLSESEKFLQEYWAEYKKNHYGEDRFYSDWLNPLFFRALNNPPGSKNFDEYDIPDKYKKLLEHAPYLNGGLFDEHRHDNRGYKLLDKEFEDIFEYIYSYNFTIEENTLYDHELELNPEFLGIIFEKLVNKELGAVYTPRTEVDFMGRLTLVKWLYKNNTENIELRDLYELFFDEIGTKDDKEDYQRKGSFSKRQQKHLLELLEGVKICDPACGSGAFLVGMLQIIDEVEDHLRNEIGEEYIIKPFDRRKRIVFSSLFGVEVKEWAVWIAQLRLWITLFIEAPDSLKDSKEAILPSLDFKIRKGDSLVQKVGSQIFSVKKFGDLGGETLRDIDKLIAIKRDYYENKISSKDPVEVVESYEAKFFTHFLEADISRLEKDIKKYRSNESLRESQGSLFGESPVEITLNKAELKDRLKELEDEKKDLTAKLEVVNKQRPLIWILEFADVFANPNKGGFDIVIGNPPYLRQEDIDDPYEKIKGYKDQLIESIKGDYPKYFSRKDKKINKQSDLYTYFYIRSLALLNERGLLTFICENSWLDVNYGAWLQEFILENAHLDLVIDNQAEKSFKEDVNTIITILEPTQRDKGKDLVKFVNFKKPFEEIIFTEKLLGVENGKENIRNEDYRLNVVTKSELYSEGSDISESSFGGATYIGDKWGSKYLKAPDIFRTIYLMKDKYLRLGDIAEVKFGLKTGANDFFYLDNLGENNFDIEDKYLVPIIKSPQECLSIEIDKDKLKNRVLLVSEDKSKLSGTGAGKYIEWGEEKVVTIKQGKRKGQTVKGYHNLDSVKSRSKWYVLPSENLSSLFVQMSFNTRFVFFFTPNPMLADARLYTIKPLKDIDEKNLCLSLNSTISVLFMELLGRSNLGAGALDFKVYEAKKLPVIHTTFPENKLIDEFLSRKQGDIFFECGFDQAKEIRLQNPKPLPDREYIDNKIFDSLGLSQEDRNEVYYSVCELVKNRIDKSNSK